MPESVRPCHCVGEPQSFGDAGGSYDVLLLTLTRCLCAEKNIVACMDDRREGEQSTAASAAYLNIAVEPTPNSLRSFLAPALGRGSPPAFGVSPSKAALALSSFI